MTREEEYAQKRMCVRCELPCPNAVMKFHHDTEGECIHLLREQVEALKPYAILTALRNGEFEFQPSKTKGVDVTYAPTN